MAFPATDDLAADPRVARGLAAQLERRREALSAGDRSLGWKLGFGAPAALEKLEISAPLVGFLLASGLHDSGSSVPVGQWANPVLEPEVAVHLARDVPAQADLDTVRASIAGIGPAFELADVEPPPEDVHEILTGNIFQRGCVLGPISKQRSLAGVAGRVVVNQGEPELVEDLEALTGETIGLVRHVADLLAAFGEGLRADEIVITGSIVPPLAVAPGDRVEYELSPVGSLSIRCED
jgi:2-keto-4-pentenoate hydratase